MDLKTGGLEIPEPCCKVKPFYKKSPMILRELPINCYDF